MLGTLSKRDEGAPFGSVAPYALDRTGAPLVYIAGIAEHTRNLRADPRVSLLIHEPAEPTVDVQTKARLCVMGEARPLSGPDLEDSWARYQSRLPAARRYQRTHDFSLWRIAPQRLRWIGGFGEIFWLKREDFHIQPNRDDLHEAAGGIITHMNEDHTDAIRDFYRAHLAADAEDAQMVGVDVFGMDFHSDKLGRLRVDFHEKSGTDRVRMDVIRAVKTARHQLPD